LALNACFSQDTHTVDMEGMLAALRKAPAGTAVMLQARAKRFHL
jgi:aspartate/tyrosine/aromatic aminotransferase